MPDEPGNAELQRAIEALAAAQRDGFAAMNAHLARLVSQDVFLAEVRRGDERYAALHADFAEEKAERVAADRDEKAEREKADLAERTARETAMTKEEGARKSVGTWVRFVAASIAIPIVLLIAEQFQGKPGS